MPFKFAWKRAAADRRAPELECHINVNGRVRCWVLSDDSNNIPGSY